MFAFAHFSDLHLPITSRPRLAHLVNKRLQSYLSWLKKRRHLHRAEVLDKALAAMRQYAPEHLCVTGDLVNLALDSEIERAADWLRSLGTELTCSVVPGNHDALVRGALPRIHEAWAPWMGGSEIAGQFPTLIRKDGLAFIGLSSAVPTPPCFAFGSLDTGQLDRLEKILATTGAEGCFRVVSIHHPPGWPQSDSWRSGLRNAGELVDILRIHGAELVLHGHLQRPTRSEIPGPTASIPVFGAGSASLIDEGKGNSGHFHGFRLEQIATGFRLRVDHFRYRSASGAFGIEATEQLEYPRRT